MLMRMYHHLYHLSSPYNHYSSPLHTHLPPLPRCLLPSKLKSQSRSLLCLLLRLLHLPLCRSSRYHPPPSNRPSGSLLLSILCQSISARLWREVLDLARHQDLIPTSLKTLRIRQQTRSLALSPLNFQHTLSQTQKPSPCCPQHSLLPDSLQSCKARDGSRTQKLASPLQKCLEIYQRSLRVLSVSASSITSNSSTAT